MNAAFCRYGIAAIEPRFTDVRHRELDRAVVAGDGGRERHAPRRRRARAAPAVPSTVAVDQSAIATESAEIGAHVRRVDPAVRDPRGAQRVELRPHRLEMVGAEAAAIVDSASVIEQLVAARGRDRRDEIGGRDAGALREQRDERLVLDLLGRVTVSDAPPLRYHRNRHAFATSCASAASRPYTFTSRAGPSSSMHESRTTPRSLGHRA